MTRSLVSKWERGESGPAGASLKLPIAGREERSRGGWEAPSLSRELTIGSTASTLKTKYKTPLVVPPAVRRQAGFNPTFAVSPDFPSFFALPGEQVICNQPRYSQNRL